MITSDNEKINKYIVIYKVIRGSFQYFDYRGFNDY